ncbi:hypothetical protein [Streptomyces sp. MUM 178J]|uniref:hypothetical protein n=1 Tax=Streptomyces sp. MUM 178J TaxID=2791991 RepID=UPI001F039C72|nr:hypothetical protein [Streptomyces sp. MUM 178J]WRQ82261.1 hypothetical protein I3F59_024505 [Streptomyces sp. MUM 178J]
MNRRKRGAVLAVAAVAFTGIGTAAFSATITDNMYPTKNTSWSCKDGNLGDGFCKTDNKTLTVYLQGSLSSAGKKKVKNALNKQYKPTDLTVTYHKKASYSGSKETDIIYQKGSVPSGYRGFAWCNDSVGNNKCDQHYVRFAKANPPASTACHETGHAVGLTHGQNASPKLKQNDSRLGCMVTPSSSSSLGKHNKSMINKTY